MSKITDTIVKLEKITKNLALLALERDALNQELIELFSHDYEGQKSYSEGIWRVTIKTPCVYSLNKAKYLALKDSLPEEFNPVKESVSYIVDKKACDKFVISAPKQIISLIGEMIEKKPGKASLTITSLGG